MTLDQLQKLLETYGCNESHWPLETREQCHSLIAREPAAQTLLKQYQMLDEQLDQLQSPEFPGLEQRVLNQDLPLRGTGLIDRLLNWLVPSSATGAGLLRPALAACLPLVLGIVVGNFYSFGFEAYGDGFQYWEDELLMLSFNDYSEIGSAQ